MSNDKSLSICLFVIICLCTFSGCSKPKTSYEYLNQARQEHQKGDDQTALINLKNALKLDPKNGEARLFLARMHNERGEGSAAEIEVRKAVELGINKSYAAPVLGEALLLQKHSQKVLDEIKVTDSDKGKVAADIYNVRGDAYLTLMKINEAKAEYEKALKEYPDSADAYLGMARLAAVKNDLNGALHQTGIALSKDGNSTRAWLLKASLLRAQEKDEEARTAYSHILQLDKNNVHAHLGLASIDIVQSKFDAATSEIDAAQKIAPKSLSVQYELALVRFRQGKFKEAQEAVEEVLKVAPDYLPGILMHGATALAQGSYEQAFSDLNRVIAEYPGNAYARRLLAVTQLKLGKPGPATKTLQPLLNSQPVDALALALAGEAQMKVKNYGKATEYLQKAIELNPAQGPQLRTQLALSRFGTGDTEQAMADLEEAAKQSPGQSPAESILITIHLRRKEYDQALTAITNMEKKLGPNPVTYTLRGLALLGKQDVAGARKSFEQAAAMQPGYLPAAVKLAQLDLRENNLDAARKHLEAVLQKDKSNLGAMLALAELAANQNQEQEYVRWLKRAIKAQPGAIVPHVKLVDYYVSKKDDASALNVAHDIVNAHPDSPDAVDLLGATQLAVGKIENAIKTYTSLVRKFPKAPIVYVRLSMAQFAAKKVTEARESLNKALELQPDFSQAQIALIRLYLTENKVGDALKIAHQMQTQHPNSPGGYDQEADILMTRKQYAQAVKAYQQGLARGAGSQGLIKLHRALNLAGDKRAAEQRLVSWINQNPNDLVVRGYAASYYMRSNRNRDAIEQYEALLKLAPRNAVALNNLAALYQRERDGRALATAEQALKLAPENPDILDTMGWILVEQDQRTRAIKLLRKASTKAPKAGVIHYHLAVALASSGQKAEAKKELEIAIASSQKFPELDKAKAMLKGL